MADAVKLVTARSKEAEEVLNTLGRATATATEHACCGVALVLLKPDGTTFVATYGRGTRVMMMGALADLQYTMAKDGEP